MKTQNRDLDFHIEADIGFRSGNGEYWRQRWEGNDFFFISFSRDGDYGDITAYFCKMKWDEEELQESGDLIADGNECLKSFDLGDWNSDDFAGRAEAFATECGF